MPLSEKESIGNSVYLKVSGEMSADQVLILEKEFEKEMAELPSGANLVLDLRTVIRIDSRGISLCVGLYKECEKRNIAFSIEAGAESFRILTQIKLDKIIKIQEKH